MVRAGSSGGGLGRILGIGAVALFAIGPALAYLQLVPARVGFLAFGLGGLLGLAALLSGIVTVVRRGLGTVSVGLALGTLVGIVFLFVALPAREFPPINDITTDTTNPPRFVTAGSLEGNRGRDMSYPGESVAQQQQAGYADLGPLEIDASVDQAFARVTAAAREMPHWEITRHEPTAYALEGVATSSLFRFQDDFVVEVRARNGGSVVHMRSKSRDGRSDIGANAARIRAFFARVQ